MWVSAACVDVNLPTSAEQVALGGLSLSCEQPSVAFVFPSLGTAGFHSSVIQLFQSSDLPLYNGFIGFSPRYGCCVFGNQTLYHPLYHESQYLVNYHAMWSDIAFGLNQRCLQVAVTGETQKYAFPVDAGLSWSAGNVSSAVSLHNVFRTTFESEVLPVFLIMEMAYRADDAAWILVGGEKQPGYDVSLRLGTCYDLGACFSLMAAYQYQPERFSGGMSFRIGNLSVTYGVQTHPELELTHAISLGWTPR